MKLKLKLLALPIMAATLVFSVFSSQASAWGSLRQHTPQPVSYHGCRVILTHGDFGGTAYSRVKYDSGACALMTGVNMVVRGEYSYLCTFAIAPRDNCALDPYYPTVQAHRAGFKIVRSELRICGDDGGCKWFVYVAYV